MKHSSKKVIWIAAVFAFLVPLGIRAQAVNCNSLVALDEAHVLTDPSAISSAASGLIDQGADVHVVSTNMDGATALSQVESKLETSCPTWLTGGHRKPNLFVMLVSPSKRKKNVFFGAAYKPTMPTEDDVNLTYSQAANPYFKQGDFTGGIAAALKDFSAKVAAYHDQVKHPVVSQTTVNEQATDLHGFWVFLGWLLVVAVVGTVVWALIAFFRRREDDISEVKAAQGDAIDARTRATDAFNTNGVTGSLSTIFANLSNSVKNDPTVDGLSVAEYRRIGRAWQQFYAAATPSLASSSAPTPVVQTAAVTPARDPASTSQPTEPSEYPPQRYSHVTHTTIVNNTDSGNDMLTGMLIGEELNQPRERDVYVEPTRSYREPDPSPSYDPPASSGSDSTWSSSDDDSSSSGSDSSFDSGSSDDGGGGSDSSF